MSKKTLPRVGEQRFIYSPTHELPDLTAVQTEWNLSEHYYHDESDPRIEKDAQIYERAISTFAKSIEKLILQIPLRHYLPRFLTTKSLRKCLKDLELFATSDFAPRLM